jgi:hypothetical protein
LKPRLNSTKVFDQTPKYIKFRESIPEIWTSPIKSELVSEVVSPVKDIVKDVKSISISMATKAGVKNG